jgi:hypothetical protein
VKGDLFIAARANAGVLIRYAYDLKDFQLAGGPAGSALVIRSSPSRAGSPESREWTAFD